MKYFFLSALFVIGLVSCKQSVKGENGVTYKSPTQYNDYIVTRQTTLMKSVLTFGKIADKSLDSADAMLKNGVIEADRMINELKGMPPYKGDSTLRDAAVKSFRFYKGVFEKDYVDILNFRKKGEENITSEDVAEVNRIVDKIGKEEEVLDKAFHNAQKNFAERNNMKLIDNSMQKEVDKLNKE